MKLYEAKARRSKLINGQRSVLERAGIENGEFRALSAEDKETVDKMADDVNNLDELIERLEALQETDPEEADRDEDDADKQDDEERSRSRRRSRAVPMGQDRDKGRNKVDSEEYRSLHNDWLRTGHFGGDLKQYRDITVSPNTSGGYLATPTKISENIVQIINNLVFMRQLAKVTTITEAVSLGVRQITTQPSDPLWTSEVGAVTTDTTMAFGQRALTPNLLSKGINVSIRELSVVPDIEDVVTDRMGYKFSVAEENNYMNGNGTGQPLGVFTASSSGIPTSQDVVCSAASSVQITADSLIAAKYSMKQPYLNGPSSAWVFSRPVIQQIRTLKDSYGRYLWVDGGGLTSAPDTLLGIPVKISEYAPSALTAGAYVGILGNFEYYEIADVNTMEIQRLNELYAGLNEVGFIGRRWTDGCPVLPEAFVRLQLHS